MPNLAYACETETEAEYALCLVEVESLSEAITHIRDRLNAAGGLNRRGSARALSAVDSDGNDSEDEVRRLWAEHRELASRRADARRQLKGITGGIRTDGY